MRMLHTMLRVGDLEKSLRFYCDVLGMRLLRRKDYPSGRFTLAFVGYGDEDTHTVIELTHNWETDHYDLGAGYGHIALGVEDIYDACQRLLLLSAPAAASTDPAEPPTRVSNRSPRAGARRSVRAARQSAAALVAANPR